MKTKSLLRSSSCKKKDFSLDKNFFPQTTESAIKYNLDFTAVLKFVATFHNFDGKLL